MKFKYLWYKLVAGSLFEDLYRTKDFYNAILDAYLEINTQLSAAQSRADNAQKEVQVLNKRMETENRDGAIAVRVIRERMQSGEISPSIVSSFGHAAKSRNMELVRENEQLRKLLRKLGE